MEGVESSVASVCRYDRASAFGGAGALPHVLPHVVLLVSPKEGVGGVELMV
jgi:hypothetical protein